MRRHPLVRIYGALLYAYPPELRRAHGAEMRQFAEDALSRRGASAMPRLIADLAVSLPREWQQEMKGRSVMRLLATGIGRDVAYAIRLLWRSPGFSAAAILTLALGIGANAAIFSLADATLLRPVQVARPSELHVIKFSSSYPDYLAYTQRGETFAGAIATSGIRANAVIDGRADLIEGRFVSGNYFDVLGITPATGRLLQPADDVRNGPIVAVLEYGWWQTRFGGRPDIVGRSFRLNGTPVSIVGVAREGFRGTTLAEAPRFFLPVTSAPRVQTGFFARPEMLDTRDMAWLTVILRLKDGVTPPAAAAVLDSVYRQFHPVKDPVHAEKVEVTPLRTRALGDAASGDLTTFVALLGGVVSLTLLIGCANLANLLLSRAAARRREIGVRLAIGAGRIRIARQLLIESLVLAFAGAAAGLFVASVSLRLLGGFQLPGGIDIAPLGLALDGTALAFTAVVATLTGVIFGTMPAWRAARTDLLSSLRDESRATSARSGLRSSLVATQVALSLVLLTGTGLFLRSLVNSLQVPLGFRVDHVATASVNLGAARYDAPRAKAFYDSALDRVRALPGVTAVSWTTVVPTTGGRVFTSAVEGYQAAPDEEILFYSHAIGPDYFAAAGTRLVRGRAFTAADTAAAPGVAIINEAAARKFWTGRDPLQGRIRTRGGMIQIVGVAEDTKVEELDEAPIPYVYLPFAQEHAGGPTDPVHLLVRTSGDEEAALGPIGGQLRALDPDAPVYALTTFAWRVRGLAMPQRMGVTLFAVFSALALTLAAIGIYGVASYVAALRTRELGIRIALGADRARIRTLVLRQGSWPVAIGVAAGLVVSALASRAASAFLRGVPPHDPLTYTVVAAALAVIALAATWIPARRAGRLDPVTALRQD